MAAPPSNVLWANVTAYQLLLSLTNLLNLPLPGGTFIPRRSARLTVLDRDVERLRMLKAELDPTNVDEVRGYLLAPKALAFEVEMMLHQWQALPRNEPFFQDLERLITLLSGMRDLSDAEGVRDLAYKLSVMLPFYEDEAARDERNATAQRWYAEREARRG